MSKTLTLPLRGSNRIARNIYIFNIFSFYCRSGLVDDDHVVSSFFNRPTGKQFLEENINGGEYITEELFRDPAELNNKEEKNKKLTKTRMTNGHRKWTGTL